MVVGEINSYVWLAPFLCCERYTHYRMAASAFTKLLTILVLPVTISLKIMVPIYIIVLKLFFSWCWSWWSPMSANVLRVAEKKLLSYLKTPYRGWYVDIGSVVGMSDKIWTIALNEESPKMPLLLLHGLGAGVGLWCLNLDSFAKHRPVYAIDILGFGRSSRPDFSSDAAEVERQLVQSVEEWRREMKLSQVILLGHSMGGFIAGAYAMAYPDRVKHLVLADPWGLPVQPVTEEVKRSKIPWWVRAIAFTMQPLNPLWALRAAGPFGQRLVEKVRPDLLAKFSVAVDGDLQSVSQYIFQCNAQKPSGESAFHALNSGFGWAKNPLVSRIDQFDNKTPITILYGSRSWMDSRAGQTIMDNRPKTCYTKIESILGAGHHVYADKWEQFNSTVNSICQLSDELKDTDEAPSNSKEDIAENPAPELTNLRVPAVTDSSSISNLPIEPGDSEIDTKKPR